MEIHTRTNREEWKVDASEHLRAPQLGALSLPPATRLSLSLQFTMYNYKVYEKVSNINRQKYTELIFTCLIDVRKSSYTQ